ncbi:unnamed protein product [Choristocarpus tenellus]
MSPLWAEAFGRMDISKLIVIWPNNIDATKTLQQGRRISVSHACPNPTAEDMSEVLKYLQLWHALQPYKGYSREPFVQGRVRVRLTDEDGIPWNPNIPDRKTLMKKMGELIPNLKTRRDRLQGEKEAKEKAVREEREKAQAAAASSALSGTNKKKGKKKGKR